MDMIKGKKQEKINLVLSFFNVQIFNFQYFLFGIQWLGTHVTV
jgi:hypothetical protein